MFQLTDNYLIAEDHLVQALEAVSGLRKVYRSCDLAEMKERGQVTPAAHVIYAGDAVPETSQGGLQGNVTQTWMIVIAVSLRDANKSGPLLASVIHAMAGLHCELGNFVRKNAPSRPGFSNGFGYYPLAYQIKFKTKGARP
ncbi:hypothetical protein Q4508_12580 [Amphritea sp. 2_MG-2023]|uniref:phage tail terminator protein n=1 Tax=Amphritea TaxID=515417 RepID=UPI001C07EB2C|nr:MULTISPECIES: hypothetical protein [Amphritea]MBU2967060.1 hypothetical protein [Amphritea atlantica]MDO6419387.1 hypothetical protein [Amphritea sp. 2_MG-2023]